MGTLPQRYRYTECRLTRLAAKTCSDIDKDTADFNAQL